MIAADSSAPKRRRREPDLIPFAGTPRTREKLNRGMVTALRNGALEAEREARNLRNLADRVEAIRLAGKDLDVMTSCRILRSDFLPAKGRLNRMLGLDWHAKWGEAHAAMFPNSGIKWGQSVSEPLATPPPTATSSVQDALSAAMAIARSASLQAVDWGREPLTEREAAVRKRWLETKLVDIWGRSMLKSKVFGRRAREQPIASDLAAAAVEARRLDAEEDNAKELAEFAEVADELDGIVRGDDDDDDDEEVVS